MSKLSSAARAELDRLVDEAEGRLLRPEAVVEFARDESTALHRCFTWDDGIAASHYRIEQARRVIRLYVVKVATGPTELGVTITTRGLLSSPIDRSAGGGYRRVEHILADDALRDAQLALAAEELRRFRLRYRHLQQLAAVIAAIEATFPEDAPQAATA